MNPVISWFEIPAADSELAVPLARVEAAGSQTLVTRALVTPEIGYFAVFRDSEGNPVGQYSMH